MRPGFWEDQFAFGTTQPVAWLLEGNRLERAANVLFSRVREATQRIHDGADRTEIFDDLELAGPASLLYGLALENLFKALLVDQGKKLVKSNGKLDSNKFGHDLVVLAGHAAFALSDEENDLLTRLTHIVIWAGRYPVAKSPEKMPLRQRNVNPEWTPFPILVQEEAIYRAIFVRIVGSLSFSYEEIPPPSQK